MGSSPLARGTPGRHCPGVRRRGLIPARAGNTSEMIAANGGGGAHPRSRGEHLQGAGRESTTLWLIPARAGNTESVTETGETTGAHPRSRGEHR